MESFSSSDLITDLASHLKQRIENLETYLGNTLEMKNTVLDKLQDLHKMIEYIYVNSLHIDKVLLKMINDHLLKNTILNNNDPEDIEFRIKVYDESIINRLDQMKHLNEVYKKEFCSSIAHFNNIDNDHLQTVPTDFQANKVGDLIAAQEQLVVRTLVVIKKYINLNLHEKIRTG